MTPTLPRGRMRPAGAVLLAAASSGRTRGVRELGDARGRRAQRTTAGLGRGLGTLLAGGFPREMSLEGNGRTLLIGNFESGQLEAVNVAALP
jgi:hypothetical protein